MSYWILPNCVLKFRYGIFCNYYTRQRAQLRIADLITGISLFLSFTATEVSAQVFQNYLNREDAPIGTVTGITQDREGFIWIATVQGLYRYDTQTFRSYLPRLNDPQSISSGYINEVICDSHGVVWTGGSGGVSRYDKTTDSFLNYRHDKARPNTLSSDLVFSVRENRARNGCWVGTAKGLNLLRPDGQVIRFPMKRVEALSRWVRCLTETADGTVWMGTYNGLVSMSADGKKLQLFRFRPMPDYASVNEFIAIYADEKGSIWLGSNTAGLIRFDIATGTFQVVDSFKTEGGELPNVSGILPDRKGKFWVATWSGLACFDPATFTSVWYTNQRGNPLSLPDNLVYALYQDRQGGIWTGGYYSGVAYLHQKAVSLQSTPLFESVSAIVLGKTKQGAIWGVNEARNQVAVLDAGTGKTATYPLKLPFPYTYNGFFLDGQLTLWCGGNSVLTAYDLRTGKRRDFRTTDTPQEGGRLDFIDEDSQGQLWVADTEGLKIFDRTSNQFRNAGVVAGGKSPGLRLLNAHVVFEDSRHRIWAGGRGRVYLRRQGKKTFEEIAVDHAADPVTPCSVWAIREDKAGRIWFALGTHGLQLYNPKGGRLERPDSTILSAFDVQCDEEGYLWINHSSRLTRYHPERKIRQIIDQLDGLPVHGILRAGTSVRDGNNRLYWATTQGVFSHLPDKSKWLDSPTGPVFTSLKLFNDEVRAGDHTGLLSKAIGETRELAFCHDQNSFTLTFALLSYFRSDRNRYAYKLEGFDQQWHNTPTPSATFTNLPPGQYSLLVQAADSEGEWARNPTRLAITILPPWWQTWYAYAGYVVLVFTGLALATRFFWLRKVHQKDRELFLAKLDFFTNISHEIRTHLTLITAPLEKAFEAVSLSPEIRTYLGYARTNSETLMGLVNELLDFRKIQSGNLALEVRQYNIVDLLHLVLSAFEYKAMEKGVTTHADFGSNPVWVWIDRAQLQKVLYNLLSNAYKYTQTNGNVWISVTETADDVFVTVKDDGKGIAPEHLRRIFTNFYQVRDSGVANAGYGIGLAFAYEIAARHRGDLTATSIPATGTRAGETSFRLFLRKGTAHFQPEELRYSPLPAVSEIVIPEPSAGPDSGRYTLLLIEDNDALRAFERDSLRDRFTILEASNGIEGLALAKVHIPDLIVCDSMLPGMDGLSVCRAVKSALETNHIPFILVSARGTNPQVQEGLEAGADDYVVKPFDLRTLTLKIDNLIQVREVLKQRYSRSLLLEPSEIVVDDRDGKFIEDLKELVLANLSNADFGVNEIALQIGTSVSVLYRKLRALTGMTVNDFMKNLRMKRAMQLLESGAYHINEVSLIVGYESARHFSREFKKAFGKTPNEIRKKESSGRA